MPEITNPELSYSGHQLFWIRFLVVFPSPVR